MTMICGKAFRLSTGLAFAAATVLAQSGDGRPPRVLGMHGRCGDRLVRALGLTAEQQNALDVLNAETAEAIRPILDQIRAIHDQIGTVASTSDPDACAIGTLVLQRQGLHSQVETIRGAAEAEFVVSLTTDQKATYDSFVAVNPGCTAVGGMRPFEGVSPGSLMREPGGARAF